MVLVIHFIGKLLICIQLILNGLFSFFFQIFGFANLFIWSASIWFVFKETHFHRSQVPQAFGGFGGRMAGMMNTTTAGTGTAVATGDGSLYPNLDMSAQIQQPMADGNQFVTDVGY